MNPTTPRLYLVTPTVADAEAFRPILAAACREESVSAVLLRLEQADERTLVNRAKALAAATHGADAALIVDDAFEAPLDLGTIVARAGADGAHAAGALRLRELRDRFGSDRSLGAGGLTTRHDAMEAGEIGADYVMFGEPRRDGSSPSLAEAAERAAWWAEIFQVPCVAYAPSLEAVPELAATGAEFLALGDAVWSHPDGPAAAIEAVLAALKDEALA